MELVIRSTGDKTSIEVDGKEIKNATMVNFIAAVHSETQCVFVQLVTDADGRPVIEDDDIKQEIHRVDFIRGEIV